MKRNADGQYPKKYYHEKDELYQAMGFTKDETRHLVRQWNTLLGLNLGVSRFLQQADLVFTKHELLFLFTMSKAFPIHHV